MSSPLAEAPKRRRARSPAAKDLVRSNIIAAGRHAFATQEFETVSLRGIAASAGISPSVIYSFFEDRQQLFLAIREKDLDRAATELEADVARLADPKARLRQLFLSAIRYWRGHLDEYEVLYAKPLSRPSPRYKDGSLFGASEISSRAFRLWERTVTQLFESTAVRGIPVKLATESLIVAMHGVVSIPLRQHSRAWSAADDMGALIVDSFIDAWTRMPDSRHRGPTRIHEISKPQGD